MQGKGQEVDLSQEPPVIVIGSGGHAGRLINILQSVNRRILFATDTDPQTHGKELDGVLIRGPDELVLEHSSDDIEIVNGIGSAHIPRARRAVFLHLREQGYRFATVLHPSAVIATSATLGEGVQIMTGAVVDHKAVVGDNCLVNTRCSISHDCQLGEHVHVAAGATVCGNVRLGDMTLVGAGATVIQGVTIGRYALIGAGALVVGPVGDHTVVMGVPARPKGSTRVTGEAGHA